MENRESIFSPNRINYVLVVIKKEDIDKDIIENDIDMYHIIGFEKEPSETDIKGIREELETDEMFGLTEMMDEMELILGPKELVEEVRKIADENFDNNIHLN